MYKNGLHFPIFCIFLFDDLIFNTAEDIINHKTIFQVASEEDTNNSIIEFINKSKGYEIYPFLLNNFSYLIQSNLKFRKEEITSKFIKITEFISLINTYKINFHKIKSSLVKLDEVGLIDDSVFYTELYSLLLKRFALKLGNIINYSDFEDSKLYLDFNNDLKLFEEYSAEIEKTRPNLIRNYDNKKQYVSAFYKSFNSKDVDDFFYKIEVLKNHTDYKINETFRQLIKKSVIINEGVHPKTRNKTFKPIYEEINSAINGKIYGEFNQHSLTKEVKNFFLGM